MPQKFIAMAQTLESPKLKPIKKNKMQSCHKTKIAAFLIAVILYTGIAFSQNTAILTSEMDSVTDGTIVSVNSNMGYAAKTVIKNNSFQFVIPAGKQWDMYMLDYHKKGGFNLPVLLKASSKLHISIDKNFDKFTITGDSSADEQNSFWQGVNGVSRDYRAVFKQKVETKDSAMARRLQAKLDAMDAEGNKYFKDWVTAHKSSPFSCTVIRMFLDRSNIKHTEDTVAEKYYDTLTSMAKVNNYQATILRSEFAMYNPIYSNNPAGNTLSNNVVLKDTSGNTISLSNCKGKYVLIDFWASWCGPCRANNPHLQELYRRYHNKGFDIFSVSVDTSKSKWKAAIRKDKMKWYNGSDLKGFNNSVASDFEIMAIPRYILISYDKKIILNELGSIEPLENKLKELLGSGK